MRAFVHEETNTTIFANGDQSGDVRIVTFQQPVIEQGTDFEGNSFWIVQMPCAPLAQFSRQETLREVTNVLEGMQ